MLYNYFCKKILLSKMLELDEKIKDISNLYRSLQRLQTKSEQMKVVNNLQILCKETIILMNPNKPAPDKNRKIKQIKEIQNKV